MPYLKNQEENDQATAAQPLSSAPTTGTASATAPTGDAPAKASGAPGTGFVNLSTVLGLNAGQGQKMADSITKPITSDAQRVQQGIGQYGYDALNAKAPDFQNFDPARYGQLQQQSSDVASRARALGSMGGQEALLAQQYGPGANGGYSGGQQAMDAFLAGAEGGRGMAAASGTYGDMDRALGLAAGSYNPTPPKSGLGNAFNSHNDGGGVASGGGVYAPASWGQPPKDTLRRRAPTTRYNSTFDGGF